MKLWLVATVHALSEASALMIAPSGIALGLIVGNDKS